MVVYLTYYRLPIFSHFTTLSHFATNKKVTFLRKLFMLKIINAHQQIVKNK